MSGVVADASPIIAPHRTDQLGLLESLFGTVFIPPAVGREVSSAPIPPWILSRALGEAPPSRVVQAGLGPGETEAIGLALECAADWIVLDDLPARRLARGLGLPVIGTLGILLAAKRRGLIPVIRGIVDALRQSGFRVADDLYEDVLLRAGESP